MTDVAQAGPVRLQRRRVKGWRMPAGAVYVGTGSRWGNPYAPAKVGRRPNEDWVVRVNGFDQVGPFHIWRENAVRAAVDRFRHALENGWHGLSVTDLEELRGKDLACWCPLEDADGMRVLCHADVLLDYANRPLEPEMR